MHHTYLIPIWIVVYHRQGLYLPFCISRILPGGVIFPWTYKYTCIKRESKREVNVMWNGTRLSNTITPVYLGIHLDRTLGYKTHIEKTKMKVNARNNIICKLTNSKWGCKASILRPSFLALCYSAAEYACPVWARSTHARKLNPALHDCCRIISGCLKPTNLDSVHLLAGIAPPHIRRTVACRMERTRQTTNARHQRFHHQPAASRLKSRKSFMRTVTPLDS